MSEPLKVGEVVREPFVYKGGLTGIYYFGRVRKVERVLGDGQYSFSVQGKRDDVTESVEHLITSETKALQSELSALRERNAELEGDDQARKTAADLSATTAIDYRTALSAITAAKAAVDALVAAEAENALLRSVAEAAEALDSAWDEWDKWELGEVRKARDSRPLVKTFRAAVSLWQESQGG